ncbi:MAG: glycosyltransferase family 2 protein [Planctomycetota bacterium]
MKISVIIPTLNRAGTIENTLESVVEQNWPDIQIIIQDGKSTDDTYKIVTRYPSAALGWQSEPDNGIYDAINKGVNRATGDIIAILNSDDVWLPNTLERVAALFSRNPDIGIVSGSIEVWEDITGGARVVLKSSLLHLHKGMTIQHPATFVRRGVYGRVGLFDERYRIGADYDFVLRCLKANIPWIITEDVLTRMMAGGKNLTSQFHLDDWKIRRSHRLSSIIHEVFLLTHYLLLYLGKQILLKTLGKRALSALRAYRWRKRIYR